MPHGLEAPEGAQWSYEVKLDGYRAQALCDGIDVRLFSRTGKDLGQRFPAVLRQLKDAIPNGSVIDGEVVALDPRGRPSVNLLQNYESAKAPIFYFAFDLLQLAGEDISKRPLAERRDLLKTSLRVTDLVQLSESFSISSKQC
jgi:ATP-dependent DNA ligase